MSKHRSPYGYELIVDLKNCDASTFNRESLSEFFAELCTVTDMEMCDMHFWDDLYEAQEDRQTSPDTKGTSAVCFILTSSIVVHTLDERREVFVNFFSCKPFDAVAAQEAIVRWFGGNLNYHGDDPIFLLERG